MKLIFVRHGQTMFNEMGLAQGWCDSPLTPLGISQAEETGAALANIQIDEAWSSSSERAFDTADLILSAQHNQLVTSENIHRDKRLREMSFGWFEGGTNKLKDKLTMPDFKSWKIELDFTFAGGESSKQVLERELQLMQEITSTHRDNGQTILIAGHGIALTSLVHELAHDAIVEKYPDFRFMGNACALILDYTQGAYAFEQIIGTYHT